MLHTIVSARIARLGLACAALGALSDAAAAQVRLRQIYGGGGQTAALYTNDFVELHNYGAPQSLAGWSLQTASAAGSSWSVAALPAVTLGAGRSFLIRMSAGVTLPAGQSMALPTPDAMSVLAIPTTDGKVALVSSTLALSGAEPSSPDIVDLVGFGPFASWNEPAAPFDPAQNAPAPSMENALVRWSCASPDTDESRVDWAVSVPSPRNSSLAPLGGLTAAGMCAPHLAEAGQSVRLDVEASTCAGARIGAGASVVADLTPLGGPANFALNDSGASGDLQAADGVWSATIAIGGATPVGTAQLLVSVLDGALATALFVGLEIRNTNAPDNDSCYLAQALSGPLPASASGVFSVGNSEHNPLLSSSATTAPGSMGARRGRWYSVLGTGATMSASTCASPLNGAAIPDTVLMVLGGSCDALSVVAYNDDAPALCGAGAGIERRSQVSWCSQAGATYWIWVAPFASGGQSFGFVLEVGDDAVACSGALDTALCAPPSGGSPELEASFGPARNDGCDSSSGVFVDANPSFPAERWVGTARQYGASRDHDWYRFQTAAATTVSATLTAQFHGVLELWSLSPFGDCNGASLVSSTSPSARCGAVSTSIPTAAGGWYAVRVVPQNTFAGAAFGGFAPGGDGVAYALDLEVPGAVANDLCANAESLACTSSTAGTTDGASLDFGLPLCEGPGAQDVSITAPGSWYSIALPGVAGVDDRVVRAELSSATFDAKLSVFEGACGSLQCVTANNDGEPGGRPRVAWLATAGSTYLVLVHGVGAQVGDFTLDTACSVGIANDACVSPTPVSGESGFVSGTLDGATGASSSTWTSLASCAPAFAFADAWYELDVACATSLSLDTCGSADTVMSVHGACPDNFGTLELAGACNDDGGGACAPGAELTLALAPGAYLVRIASAQPAAAFTLSWSVADSDGDGVRDCSDGCPSDPLKTSPGVCGCGVQDTDSDGDSVPDCNDGCPLDPFKLAPGVCGCGVSDVDSDGDGVADCVDGCPSDPLKVAPGQCGCGALETDTDLDGVADCVDGCPSDPLKVAPGVCGCGSTDADSDGDGTPDCNDGCPLDPLKLDPGVCGCGVEDVDSDGDTVLDCFDGCPNDPSKTAPGVCGCGQPDVDSDGDGALDCNDGCPLDPLKVAPGPCGCGVVDLDSDGDGVADCVDGCPSDPLKVAPGQCGCGALETDTDLDGVADCVDGCPNDPLKSAPGVCGCGVADDDSDGDGTPDCNDGCPLDPLKLAPGGCGCGVEDVDSDGDTVLDCNDGCPLDPLKTAPGLCGCGQPDVDSDGDGALDCNDGCPLDPLKVAPGPCGCGVVDLDSDGDGVADCVDGCPSDPLKTAPGQCGCGALETDTDLDGVADCVDNCVALANPGQEDCDFDTVGDVCELSAGTARDLNFNGQPDNCELGAYFNYCTAGTSTNGCVATIGGAGAFSASASSGFVVSVQNVEGQKQGILFFGITGPSAQPWFGGSSSYKCVKAPLQRMSSQNSQGTAGLCDGAFSDDVLVYFTNFPTALGAPLAAGQLYNFQAWYRDPPAPSTTNLSDALQATCAP
jgi:hypothetical protein